MSLSSLLLLWVCCVAVVVVGGGGGGGNFDRVFLSYDGLTEPVLLCFLPLMQWRTVFFASAPTVDYMDSSLVSQNESEVCRHSILVDCCGNSAPRVLHWRLSHARSILASSVELDSDLSNIWNLSSLENMVAFMCGKLAGLLFRQAGLKSDYFGQEFDRVFQKIGVHGHTCC